MDALVGETDPRVRPPPPPPACWAELSAPPWGAWGRAATLGLVAAAGKLLLSGLNTTTVESPGGAERLRALVMDRHRPHVVVAPVDDDDALGGGKEEEAAASRQAAAAAAESRGTTTTTLIRPGLLTYSNHTSTFDDPGVLVALLPLSLFWTEPRHGLVRWTLCASEVCFRNAALAAFFRSGKAFPVERGGGNGGGAGGGVGYRQTGVAAERFSDGTTGGAAEARGGGGGADAAVAGRGGSGGGDSGKARAGGAGGGLDQPAMVAAAHALGARGDWVHLFPEGKVYDFRRAADREAAAAAEAQAQAWRQRRQRQRGQQRQQEEQAPSSFPAPPLLGPFRQGVGKLVCDARAAAGGRDPLVVPIAHQGMEKVLPRGQQWPRAFGQRVRVTVGEPVDLRGLTCACDAADPGERERAWRDIAAALRAALSDLQRTINDETD